MREILFKAIGVCLLIGSIAGGWFLVDYSAYLATPLRIDSEPVVFEVTPGASVQAVSRTLAERGLLTQPRYFEWYARLQGQAGRIHAGEYALTPGMTPRDLLALLTTGKVVQHAFTLVEGWTFAQVRAALDAEAALQHVTAGLSDAQIMQRLGAPGLHPEGRFLPDTYFYTRGATDLSLLQRAFDAMQAFLAAEWERRDPTIPLQTPDEALILASIVEKETGRADERPLIAGVFVRRLQIGMRLQSDPTVIYGLGERFDGNLKRVHLNEDNPYNTYRRNGLPPTPIAMPGPAAIRAVLHPAPTDALYFVARGDGSHVFSKTLKEHNAAVIEYQRKGRGGRFSSNPPEPEEGSR